MKLNNDYNKLVDDYNELKKNDEETQNQLNKLKSQQNEPNNEGKPNYENEDTNKLIEDNKSLKQELDYLQSDNNKLNEELNKLKDLQNIVDEIKKDWREQAKHYDTEGICLDYLRPYDFSDVKMEFNEEDNNRQMLEQKGIRLHPGQPTRLSRKTKTSNTKEKEEENNEETGGKFTVAGRRNRRFNRDN